MNYWPAEVTNLSELHEPLFDLIDNAREDGRRVARSHVRRARLRRCTTTPISGDTRCRSTACGRVIWPMGGAWLSLHLWDHYDLHARHGSFCRTAPIR